MNANGGGCDTRSFNIGRNVTDGMNLVRTDVPHPASWISNELLLNVVTRFGAPRISNRYNDGVLVDNQVLRTC